MSQENNSTVAPLPDVTQLEQKDALLHAMENDGLIAMQSEPMTHEYICSHLPAEFTFGDRLQPHDLRHIISSVLASKPEPVAVSDAQAVREALLLMNSMIACGEDHSETSRAVLATAFKSLASAQPIANNGALMTVGSSEVRSALENLYHSLPDILPDGASERFKKKKKNRQMDWGRCLGNARNQFCY